MKLFRANTKVATSTKTYDFTDWFEAETLEQAKSLCDAEAKDCGVPMDDRRTVDFVECDPKTLKPIALPLSVK